MALILIIDDDASFREMYRAILEQEGHQVLAAENGSKGIELFSQHTVDVVITDLIMPEKEGIETIMEIVQIEPEAKIIAISASGGERSQDYLESARMLGASSTLRKPFHIGDLLAAVQTLLAD